MKKSVENRTMSVVLGELNESVDKYNETADATEKVQLVIEHKKLVAEYNELSLLHAYATFMSAEVPVVALAKAFYYDTVNTKDTAHNEVDPITKAMKSTTTRSVVDGKKKLDVAKFIEWTAERNKCVAADKMWRVEVEKARKSVENEWKRFFNSKADKKEISIGAVKRATQKAFDAIVFVPCENNKDKNAIIANGDVAKMLIAFANKLQDSFVDGEVDLEGKILPRQTWNTLLLAALHLAAKGKTYKISYGIEEEEAKAKGKTDAPADTEAEAEVEA